MVQGRFKARMVSRLKSKLNLIVLLGAITMEIYDVIVDVHVVWKQ